MTIDSLKSQMPDFAKDVKLNLSNIAGDETLTEQQKYGLMVSCAIATRNAVVREAFLAEAADKLSPEALTAAKGAATMMGMNNVLLPFRSSCFQQGICVPAGQATHELHWSARR